MSSTFEEACTRYLQFLADNGYRGKLLWVTLQDVLFTDRRLVLVRTPIPPSNLEHSRELYETAIKERSGGAFSTVCETDHATCCTVWVPADEDERQRAMCPRDLKMSASTGESRIRGKEVGSRFLWRYLRFRYRSQQENKEWLFWG